MTAQRILIVDDEPPMRKYLAANLKARGYDVLVAEDGSEALKLIAEHPIDLLLLDIMMPGPDGLSVLQAVRRELEVPVIMLSARGREGDKVEALDLGADDYLTKPFGVEELLARVRSALRRAGSGPKGPLPPYRHGELEVDFGAREARRGGQRLALTPREFDYLWTYVRRIRRKVEPDPERPRYLLTEPGVGYRVPPAE